MTNAIAQARRSEFGSMAGRLERPFLPCSRVCETHEWQALEPSRQSTSGGWEWGAGNQWRWKVPIWGHLFRPVLRDCNTKHQVELLYPCGSILTKKRLLFCFLFPWEPCSVKLPYGDIFIIKECQVIRIVRPCSHRKKTMAEECAPRRQHPGPALPAARSNMLIPLKVLSITSFLSFLSYKLTLCKPSEC